MSINHQGTQMSNEIEKKKDAAFQRALLSGAKENIDFYKGFWLVFRMIFKTNGIPK